MAHVFGNTPSHREKKKHSTDNSQILITLSTLYMFGCFLDTKVLHYSTYIGITLHIIGYILGLVYLLTFVKDKQTAHWVFTDQTNYTGWNNGVSLLFSHFCNTLLTNVQVAWSIGIMSSALSMIGWDSSTHMAEEMKHASRDLPRTSKCYEPKGNFNSAY